MVLRTGDYLRINRTLRSCVCIEVGFFVQIQDFLVKIWERTFLSFSGHKELGLEMLSLNDSGLSVE